MVHNREGKKYAAMITLCLFLAKQMCQMVLDMWWLGKRGCHYCLQLTTPLHHSSSSYLICQPRPSNAHIVERVYLLSKVFALTLHNGSLAKMLFEVWLNSSHIHKQNLHFLLCLDTVCQSANIFPEDVKVLYRCCKVPTHFGNSLQE
jgi:hypothetical protein